MRCSRSPYSSASRWSGLSHNRWIGEEDRTSPVRLRRGGGRQCVMSLLIFLRDGDRAERDTWVVLDLLRKSDTDHSRPRKTARRRLRPGKDDLSGDSFTVHLK